MLPTTTISTRVSISLMLDEDRQYSCAYFPEGGETLEEAQLQEEAAYCCQAEIPIGPIWKSWISDVGGAEWRFTLPGIQCACHRSDLVDRTARGGPRPRLEAGLEHRVKFELMDIDRGPGLSTGWSPSACSSMSASITSEPSSTRCTPMRQHDGVARPRAIGRADGPGSTNPWIAKYIFPGGYSPALSRSRPQERSTAGDGYRGQLPSIVKTLAHCAIGS